jgi:hypothetical protein
VLNTFVTDVKCDMPRVGGNNTSVVDTKLASGRFGGTHVNYLLTFCCLLAYTIRICEVEMHVRLQMYMKKPRLNL